MFERYTERSRRVIFFARYEASQLGSTTIETEHLLLGLIREDRNILQRFQIAATSIEIVRKEIEDQIEHHEKTSTSIDLPLSDEGKRILGYAANEADRFGHTQLGIEHLLLGMLREESCLAAKVLRGLGIELNAAREEVSRSPSSPAEFVIGKPGSHRHSQIPETPMPAAGVVPDVETARRIAEAVWLPRVSTIPGDRISEIQGELKFGVWIVTGTHTRNDIQTPLAAFIQKDNGTILRLSQEKTGS